MTNDEIKRYMEALQYDIGASVPGAEFDYKLCEEVLKLRARLAALEPLASAAVAYGDSKGKRWSEIESSIYVMCDAAIAFAELARAQAQDGAA